MRFRTILCAVIVTCAAVTNPALAQPSQAEIEASKKIAAEAANKAFDAFKDGKYDVAIAGFQQADKAFHASKFVLYIARSQAKLGKLGAAKATYETLVKEQLATYAPPEFFAAQADAKKELVDLLPRIPTLTIQAKPGVTSVTLDGQPTALGQPISLDPGEHTVAALGPNNASISRKVTLQERDAKTETLEPPAVTPPVATATVTAAPTATQTTSASPSTTAAPTAAPAGAGSFLSNMPTVTKVTYGVGAAGLIVGAVFGGLTLSTKGDYDALKTSGNAADINAAASQGKTFAIVTDVGFLAAIAGAAAGTIVWIVSPSPSGAPASPNGTKTGRSVLVTPRANGLSIGGTF